MEYWKDDAALYDTQIEVRNLIKIIYNIHKLIEKPMNSIYAKHASLAKSAYVGKIVWLVKKKKKMKNEKK